MSAGKSDRTMLPDWAFFHLRGTAAFAVLYAYCYFRNDKDAQCNPSAYTVAKLLGVSRQHVMAQIKRLRECGALVPRGTIMRSVDYQIPDGCPVNAALTGSCQRCPDKTKARSVNTDTPKCQGNEDRPVNSPCVNPNTNGTRTEYKNGSIERPPFSLAEAIKEDLRAALKPFKPESAIDNEVQKLIQQVGAANIPRLIGWLRSESTMKNPVGFAISKTKAGEDAPRETKAGLRHITNGECVNCEQTNTGSLFGEDFWCLDCIEQTRATYCGSIACQTMHFPWERCPRYRSQGAA